MISSKGVKTLCYIMMVCVFLVSIGLIIFGIYGITTNNWTSVIWVVVGILLPLIASVSLYPIFALANIDENISLLNEKLDIVASQVFSNSSRKEYSAENKFESRSNSACTIEFLGKKIILSDKMQDAIDFINQKYGIDINAEDSLDTIKIKIQQINTDSSSAKILIQKVLNASDMEPVLSAFVLHKASHT